MALIKINTRSIPDAAVTPAKVSQNLGRRNMVINGDMSVAQRATSLTGNTTSGFKTVDRFQMTYGGGVSAGTYDHSRVSDGPQGFKYSTKVIHKGAPTSPNEYAVRCFLEFQNIRHIYGKYVTYSFYYKSNKIGEHATRISHSSITGAVTENIPFTVNTADTWERKIIVMDNFVNATGDSGSDTAWGIHFDAGFIMNAVGVNPVAVDDYFQITGVQLEVGDTATDFEHRSFGEEFLACQRYYEKSFDYLIPPAAGANSTSFADNDSISVLWSNNGNARSTKVDFKVQKKDAPSVTRYGNDTGLWAYQPQNSSTVTFSGSIGIASITDRHFSVSQQAAGGAYYAFGHWVAESEV